MSQILHTWFSWPDGAVLTNLVASAIWVSLAAWRLVKKLNRIHAHAEAAHNHAREAHREAEQAKVQAIHAHNSAQLAHASAKAAHDHVVANMPAKRATAKPKPKPKPKR